MVKVSVIVAAYNVEKYIRRCLDSLVNQTLQGIEIIIIDDSTDNTPDIIRGYQDRYENIIYYKNPKKQGLGFARNKGFQLVRGEYIAFVDADDYVELDMYEVLYNKAAETDSDIVYASFYKENELTKTIEVYDMPIKPKGHYKLSEQKETFQNFSYPVVWNKIYKYSFIKENNFKNMEQECVEDVSFTLPSFLKANRISYVDRHLYHYMIYRDGSLSMNYQWRQTDCLLRAYDYVLDYYRNNSVNGEFDTALEVFVVTIFLNIIRAHFYANESDADDNEKARLLNYLNQKFPLWEKHIEEYDEIKFVYRYIRAWDMASAGTDFFDDKKIVIFSASQSGRALCKHFQKNNRKVYAFCDNNKKLQGTYTEDVPILSVEEAARKFYREGFFVIGADPRFYKEMQEQLVSLGIQDKNIY